MADTHDDLVGALRDLGERLELPAADPVAGALARIGTPEAAFRSREWLPARPIPRTKRVVVAAAAVLVVALAATTAVPGSRRAVADWLGIGRVSVTYTGEVPADAGRTFDLGTPVSLAEAVERAEASGIPTLEAPAAAGDPDRAFVGQPAGAVTLTWAASRDLPEVGDSGIGLLLAALPDTPDAGAVRKLGTSVEEVQVGDERALWVAGERHVVLVEDPEGEIVRTSTRLAGNALVWEDGNITYRLESALDRDAAIELASSLRRAER
ncbi:MAG TPA: hypothetical protein VE575_00120 [Acidimicrobiales bacterium]|nr:hypothetical protein [Acidimicrobiales bacterium]